MRVTKLVVLLILASLPSLASAQCEPQWEALFPAEPGVGRGDGPGAATCSAVFDDGSGPALYVGGMVASAGGQPMNDLARWDGSAWSDPGGDLSGAVHDMAVADLGDGEKLYLVGNLSSAGGVPVDNVVSWDGTTWADVGGGTNNQVYSLHVIEGSTDTLVLGGTFDTVGGSLPALRIATWDGSTWSALGDGFVGQVEDIIQAGTSLYAGGRFSASGSTPLSNLARWDGSAWVDVAGGANDDVNALLSWPGGGGLPAGLYIGGEFSSVGGGQPATRVARWDGVNWNPMSDELNIEVEALEVWDSGSGPELYAGGFYTIDGIFLDNSHIARWDTGNGEWKIVGGGTDERVEHLFVHDDGAGESLWLGGSFGVAGGAPVSGITRWDGSSFTALGPLGFNDRVYAVHQSDLGGTTRLWVGGEFNVPNTIDDQHLAYWELDSWVSVGGANAGVFDFVEFDDGTGSAVYAVGSFSEIGGVSAESIAKWTGSGWAALGAGIIGTIRTAEVFDDGTGEALYVGGSFFGAFPDDIARWDGSSWSAVGVGLPGFGVNALHTWDDGSGEALYATGFFDVADGAPADGIAAWDGSSWSSLGSGLDSFGGSGDALEVFDDGSGEKLYVGGSFNAAGGLPGSASLAAWDGTSWSAPGGFLPFDSITSLCAAPSVGGCALYLGGDFEEIGGSPFTNIARWDGSGYSSLGQGILGANPGLRALEIYDEGSGPRLIAGGAFTTQPDTPGGASYLAVWNGCWGENDAWTDLGSALAGVSGDPLLEADGALVPESANTLLLSNAAPSAMAGVFVSVSSTPTPFLGGTLIPFPYFGPFFAMTSPTGTITLEYVPEACLPAGFELFVQWGIDDDAGPFGVALSNAVVGVAP